MIGIFIHAIRSKQFGKKEKHWLFLFCKCLLLNSFILLIIENCLYAIRFKQSGNIERSSFFSLPLLHMIQSRKKSPDNYATYSENGKDVEDHGGIENQSFNREDIDPEVREEEKLVLNSISKPSQNTTVSKMPIQLAHLRKQYGSGKRKIVAVKDVTIGVRKAECFGLLGPNGAGKTTLLSMLAGLVTPTYGDIFFEEKPSKDIKDLSRIIGVCPQFDTVWPDLTVEEHFHIYARLHGVTNSSQRKALVFQIAEKVGLDGDGFKRQCKQLSGGMRRRLSIGIALTGTPKILVCDEPTTGLDPETRREIWKIFEELKHEGNRSVVITTHSMEEADVLCHRIGIMCNGKLRVLGNQIGLKKRYETCWKVNYFLCFFFFFFFYINIFRFFFLIFFFFFFFFYF